MDVPGWSAGPTLIQRIPLYATPLRTSQAPVAQTRRRMLAPDDLRKLLAARPWPGFSVEAVQTPARVNVTCVTPLGEEVASTL
jgi:hypothetical protein